MTPLIEVRPQEQANSPAAAEFTETLTPPTDPRWNFIPRTALMYSIPLVASAYCLYRNWITTREFWVPLAFTFLALVPGTRLRCGKPFAYKDFMDRDRFLATYALFPASVWCLAINSITNPLIAALGFLAVLVAHDALLLRFELLSVYALDQRAHLGAGTGVLTHFSLPLWSYAGVAFLTVHSFGSNNLSAAIVSCVLSVAPVTGVLLYWVKRRAPPQRFERIRKVAVVGAGWSGIYAVKWLSRAGLDVTCFEASDSVGGIWNYRPDRPGGVFEATRVTSSKHFLHPSDYPLPASFPEFPHRSQVLEHLQCYVDHFGIRKLFRLNTKVLAVEKAENRWRVLSRDFDGRELEENFDAVVVSSGPHQNPNIDYTVHPLYRHFKGRLLHSHEYKRSSDVRSGETVLIVGTGESAADIVAECVQAGAKLHWAAHGGQWFADRNMGPYPADHITTQGTRVFAGRFGFFEYLVRRFVTGAFVNLAWGRAGHGIAEWLPNAPYLHQFLNKSRDGLLEIYKGNVVARRAPVRIMGNDVYFKGDVNPLRVDTIILATGFRPTFPFLSEPPKSLFKLVFHPETPTLAFVGFARPIVGSIPSLSELQARWIAKVWSGETTIPGTQVRFTETHLDSQHHRKQIRDSSELGLIVDQEIYATELASRFNAQVHWLKLLFSWPRAFFLLLASPWAPFKFWFNDADRERREEALGQTIQELPDPRSPSYLVSAGVVFTISVFAAVALLIFFAAPAPSFGFAALGLVGLALACGLRWTENDRNRKRIVVASKFREIFPF